LPTPRIQLIGREQDSAAVRDLVLQAPGRLVTLTGPGGCGKTQLALHVAADLVGILPDGVWLVDLAPVQAGHLVPYAVAAVLRCRERAHETIIDALAAHLADRELLLVLDNCEHLVDACAGLGERLLSSCPHLRILATSREHLRIQGELVWRVPSLATPDSTRTLAPADLVRYPAIQLFVQRAQAVQPAFALGSANASAVAAVCARLDGLPLALELAAARVSVLSLPQILEHLNDRFRLLVGGSRTAPARQQTLRAALDWSYGLLSPAERAMFRRLAIFVGGWSLEAAEAVCTDGAIARAEVLELLTHLVDKSLVMVTEQDGRARYRLLDTVRAFGLEQLVAQRELEQLQEQHAACCVHLAEQAATALVGPDQATWLDSVEGEHDNLRAALKWAAEHRDVETGTRLAGALGRFWNLRGHLTEGRQWAEAFLALGSCPAVVEGCAYRTKLLHTASGLAMAQGDLAAAADFAKEGLALARACGNRQEEAGCLLLVGHVARLQGQFDRAATCLEHSLALQRALADPWGIAGALEALATLANWQGEDERAATLRAESLALFRSVGAVRETAVALFWLGELACRRGEHARAAALDEESLAVFRSLGDERSVASALAALGDVTLAQGTWQQAARRYGEALELFRRLGDRDGVRRSVHGLACAAAHGSRPERAARLLGAADALAEALGVSPPVAEQRQYEHAVGATERQLSGTRWAAAWAAGRALALDQAIALAEVELRDTLLSARASPPAGAVSSPLTSRQQEVAVLVAQGLTNRQIGQRLVVTEAAAAKHVEHILDKLGVGTRAQIAAWVAERGLLTTRSD
jgi:non-specific serine/threonine protein kinase